MAGVCFLAVAGVVMLWQSYSLFAAGIRRVQSGLLLVAMVCVPLFLGAFLFARSFSDESARRRVVRRVVAALFAFYLVSLFAALIVSRIDFENFAGDVAFYRENIDLMTNFQPFATIRLYLRALKYNYIGSGIPIFNLIGNVLLFMPMALFLPALFPSMQKPWRFVVLMAAVLLAVESLQLILCCGSCDVDDVLLNLAGTLLVYFLFRISAVQRLLRRLYLLPEANAGSSGAAADDKAPLTNG